MFLVVGCKTTVLYLAPYHPSEHKVMLVLIPKGKAGTVVGRMLDRIENEPFRIVSIPEEECHLRSEVATTYDLLGRVTADVAIKMAKWENATIVVYYDPEPKKKEENPSNSSSPPLSPAGTQTQNFDDATQAPSKPYSSDDDQKPFDDIRLAILDVRTSTVLWYESLAASPSESAMRETAKRLITDTGSVK